MRTTTRWCTGSRSIALTGKGRGADKYLILDDPVTTGKRLREAQCEFWEPYFFRSITAAVPAHTP